jgi:hypothetical protein
VLLPLADCNSHILEILVFNLVSLSEALGFILVAKYVVGVLEDRVDLFCVELDEEASAQVETERLVLLVCETSVSL